MKEKDLAPILLFVYKRIDTLTKVVEALCSNELASDSELYIYSDAAKSQKDIEAVGKVRAYIKTITGFKKIYLIESDKNKGLANSIIAGVTEVINEKNKVIVLEDDLVTSSNFLVYMNQTLDHYTESREIISVSGFSLPMKGLSKEDIYFSGRFSSWGWATWKDRWEKIDWEAKDVKTLLVDKRKRKAFNFWGSDMSGMLGKQFKGKINSWAIRACYHQFKYDLYSVCPAVSKVDNIGFSNEAATNTKEKINRYKTKLDDSGNKVFCYKNMISLNTNLIKQFVKPYSMKERIKYKIINSFFRFI